MPEKINQRDSFALYFIKAVAIFATITAHVNELTYEKDLVSMVSQLWSLFACLAVGNFMICGGVVFHREAGDTAAFWKKRLKTMILPWLFCAALTYAYRALWGYDVGVLDFAMWTLGFSTWFYFVPVYLVLHILFQYAARSTGVLRALLLVTPACLVLRRLGLPVPITDILDNDFLNPLNWISYFSLGILLRRRGLRLSRGVTVGAFLVFTVTGCYAMVFKTLYVMHPVSFFFICSSFVVLLTLGRGLCGSKAAPAVRWLGSRTYCVYLLHMQVVTTLARHIPARVYLAPWVGLAAMAALVWLGEWLTAKLPFGGKLRMLVGLK